MLYIIGSGSEYYGSLSNYRISYHAVSLVASLVAFLVRQEQELKGCEVARRRARRRDIH